MNTDYLRGFNEGYVMAQYLPGVAEAISAAFSLSERMKGFRDGCLHHAKEQAWQPPQTFGVRLPDIDREKHTEDGTEGDYAA